MIYVYGIIAISLLALALIVLLILKLSPKKRISFLRYSGISLAIIVAGALVYVLGYYNGFENSRKITKAEQAFTVRVLEKNLQENEDPVKVIRHLFTPKAMALIDNFEMDKKSFYGKLKQMGSLYFAENKMEFLVDGALIKLCADIEEYNIDPEIRKSLKEYLKTAVQPHYQDDIDFYLKCKEREASTPRKTQKMNTLFSGKKTKPISQDER